MPTDVIMRVVPGGALAVNHIEADKLDQLVGQELMASFKRPRNLAFLRKYMALLGEALPMADTEYNPEQFRAICTVGAGWCTYVERKGKLIAIPKSMSFANMDDTEFERLYQATITFIVKEWPLDESQLNAIVEFM